MLRYLKRSKRLQSVLWVVLIVAAWELSARLGWVNGYILPPFSRVVSRLASELFAGKLGVQTVSSLRVVFYGYALSFLLAVVFTALCSWTSAAESLFNTLSTIMNPLPAVAVMPLIVMWFGIDETAMYIIVIHGVLWTMVRHLLDGLRSVPASQIEFGRNIGLNARQMFTGVVVYAVMPELIAGLRVGWGRAWRALIGAEMVFGMIGSSGGLGYYIYIGRAYAKIADVFSGIIVIAAIGIIAESFIFNNIERVTTRKWGMTRV